MTKHKKTVYIINNTSLKQNKMKKIKQWLKENKEIINLICFLANFVVSLLFK